MSEPAEGVRTPPPKIREGAGISFAPPPKKNMTILKKICKMRNWKHFKSCINCNGWNERYLPVIITMNIIIYITILHISPWSGIRITQTQNNTTIFNLFRLLSHNTETQINGQQLDVEWHQRSEEIQCSPRMEDHKNKQWIIPAISLLEIP